MCNICKGKDLKCKCRNKLTLQKDGQSAHISKSHKIINQKGAFGRKCT